MIMLTRKIIGALGLVLCWLLLASGSAIASTDTMPTERQQARDPSWWEQSPWGDPDRGFNWYPDQVRKKKEETKPEKERQKSLYEMTDFEEIQKEIKRLKEMAILNPTEKNVHEFLKAQNWMMDKSAVFADQARRVAWQNADVSYNAKSPVVNFARQRIDERRANDRKQMIKQLSQDHGLIFFAKSDCAYCHDQAPILKGYQNETGMPIIAISLDGGPIAMFPDAKKDNGISMVLTGGQGVPVVPAIYLVNRKTNQAIPIATGVVAADEISERIRVLTKTEPGQEL